MKKIAIVYATKFGQTKKIAKYIEEKLQERGFSTQLLNVKENSQLSSEVEGVIYGGPVYQGKFSRQLIQWVKKNRPLLNTLPTALFTVSLNAADKRAEARAADLQLIQNFIAQSGYAPNLSDSFAGALMYRSYFWPVRLLMRRISRLAGGDTDTSKNYEYTDWARIESFLSSFQNLGNLSVVPVNLKDRRAQASSNPLSKEEWEQVVL